MAGFGGKLLLAGLFVLGATSSADAWWGWRGWGYGPAYYTSAYYVPAYYYYPAVPVCATVIPTPAPALPPAKKVAETVPSGSTKEPPVLRDGTKKGPTVTESRSKSGGYVLGAPGNERCKVGFWNLTGRDVTLMVQGQQRLLAKDRAVTLDLERSFSWQIDQGQAVSERVPEEQPFHEVILRQ